MGNDQCLHHHGVFFHEIRNTGIGVDDDFVSEPHLPPVVGLLNVEKLFAIGPVAIADGHADGRVGVHHLFGTDDFNLVGISVQAIFFRNLADCAVIGLDQLETPL